jgi:CHAD domain-containing protein
MSETTARPVEVELKYRVVDLAAAERYLVAEEIGAFSGTAAARSSQFEDRYVDTADGALTRAGFAVRVRQSGRGTVVSVKSLTRSEGPGGSVRREELEGPADRTAGPLEWPASDARSLVLELAGDAPLLELVTIRQLRRKRVVRDGDTRVELSLDEVDVVSRSRVVDRFVELEAELVKGAEERLAPLAEVFAADPALAPASGSKLEAALAAVRSGGRPGHGSAEDLDADAAFPRADANRTGADADGAGADSDGAGAEAPERRREARRRSGERTATRARADGAAASSGPARPSVREAAGKPRGATSATTATGPTDEGATSAHEHGPVTPTSSDVVSEAVDEAVPIDNRLVVGKTPGVTAEDHVAEAGRKVMKFHLARMLAREAGTREGVDPEELHAMRVATRRQRAAWRVFGASFRPRRTKRYRRGLREIAARLGAVRDLDVLLDAADAYRADLPVSEQRALEPLLADWREHRDDARVLLVRELDSDGYRRWVDDYRDFVRTEGVAVMPVGPTEPHHVRDTAASRIWAAYEQVRGYEPILRWADVETLHELRIAGKWLRYTLEFVREALGDDAAPLIARVTALQDHLGLMNDADVSASMARTFLVEHAGELSALEGAAIGRYLVSREREVARLRRTIGRPWRGVAGITFRRTLGRVVARL